MASVQVKLRGRLGESLGLVFLGLFGAAFATLGVYAGVTEVAEALAEEDDRKFWVSLMGGAVFVAFGVGAMALAFFAHRRAGKVEAEAELQAAGVPAHRVADSVSMQVDPQLVHRGHFVSVPHAVHGEVTIEGPRYRLSRTPASAGPIPTRWS